MIQEREKYFEHGLLMAASSAIFVLTPGKMLRPGESS